MGNSPIRWVPGHVDRCEVLLSTIPLTPDRQTVPQGEVCMIGGWIFGPPNTRRVEVLAGSSMRLIAARGFERGDVAEQLGRPEAEHCGFQTLLRSSELPIGDQELYVECIDDRGIRFRGDGKPFVLTIVDAGHAEGTEAFGHIDEVRVGTKTVSTDGPIVAHDGDTIVIRGWAADAKTNAPGAAVFLLVNGRPIPALYGLERTDVAELKGESMVRCGFIASIDAAALPAGDVRVTVAVLADEGVSMRHLTEQSLEIRHAAESASGR